MGKGKNKKATWVSAASACPLFRVKKVKETAEEKKHWVIQMLGTVWPATADEVDFQRTGVRSATSCKDPRPVKVVLNGRYHTPEEAEAAMNLLISTYFINDMIQVTSDLVPYNLEKVSEDSKSKRPQGTVEKESIV